MAKKNIDMSKLTLGSAKPIVKKTATVGDAAVAKIHSKEVATAPAKQVVTERMEVVKQEPVPQAVKSVETKRKAKKKTVTNKKDLVRITVDLHKPMHKKIKIKALHQETSIRDYIIGLIEKDLKKG